MRGLTRTYRKLEGNGNQRVYDVCSYVSMHVIYMKTKQNKEVKRPNEKIRLENKFFFYKQYKLPK